MVLPPESIDNSAVNNDDTNYWSGVEPIEDDVDIPRTAEQVNKVYWREWKTGPNTANKPEDEKDHLDLAYLAEDAVFVVKWVGNCTESVKGKKKDVQHRGLIDKSQGKN